MSDKKVIRVGLIGHQFMGVAHSNAYRNAGSWYDLPCKIEMKAVCAKDSPQKIAAFADRWGWQSCTDDWRTLVARDDIDLISVAVPGFLHKDIVLEAAKNGKHILCEKPLANNLADAEEMVEAVEKAGVRHCCGYSYRQTPALGMAKRLFDEGKIGRVYNVHVRYAQDWLREPDFPMVWRLEKELSGSGALGDICAHSIDSIKFITGFEITKLVGQLTTLVDQRPREDGSQANVTVDDVAQFLCMFNSGATGCFEATRMASGRRNQNGFEINGDKGSLYWTFEEQDYLYYYDNTCLVTEQGFRRINCTQDDHPYNGGYWPPGHGLGYADTFVNEIRFFVSAIAEGKPFSPDFYEGLTIQRVLDAIERSANKQEWVRL